MTLSGHLKSLISEVADESTKELLTDIVPKIEALERRNERIENRHRNLRVRYNMLYKNINVIKLLVQDSMLDPHKPEDFEKSVLD